MPGVGGESVFANSHTMSKTAIQCLKQPYHDVTPATFWGVKLAKTVLTFFKSQILQEREPGGLWVSFSALSYGFPPQGNARGGLNPKSTSSFNSAIRAAIRTKTARPGVATPDRT